MGTDPVELPLGPCASPAVRFPPWGGQRAQLCLPDLLRPAGDKGGLCGSAHAEEAGM